LSGAISAPNFKHNTLRLFCQEQIARKKDYLSHLKPLCYVTPAWYDVCVGRENTESKKAVKQDSQVGLLSPSKTANKARGRG
jgi:hypothetical protein